jgi:hypothetical protein
MNPTELRKHLDRLEKDSKLEKQLESGVDHLPWADIAWAMQYPALIGLVIQIVSMATAARPADQRPPAVEIAWTLFLALMMLVLRLGWPLLRSARERRRLRLRRRGWVVPAAIVQINNGFYAGDNTEWCPGSLLLSADPKATANPKLLLEAADRIGELGTKDRRQMPAAHAEVAWALYHQMAPVKSVPVPPELAGGLGNCMLVSVQVPPQPLSAAGTLWALTLADDLSPDAVAILPSSVVP